jgi:hypothetical protein
VHDIKARFGYLTYKVNTFLRDTQKKVHGSVQASWAQGQKGCKKGATQRLAAHDIIPPQQPKERKK